MKIIATQGYKNSGKTEVAQMLQFILNCPAWMHRYWIYKRLAGLTYSDNKYQIISYAERLKEVAAAILGVPVENFEDRDFKENYYVDFTTLTITHKENIKDESKILNDVKFSKEVKRLDMRLAREYYLSVRQVLQYLGTEILRHYLGENLWILSALKSKYRNIIISDQRFLNEHKSSKKEGAIVIHITRPGCTVGTHASEAELQILEEKKMYDYMIVNKGTLKDLFIKCKSIINDINK